MHIAEYRDRKKSEKVVLEMYSHSSKVHVKRVFHRNVF